MKAKPIYIEAEIHCDMDTLWEHTQNPKLHEQWDLRFSEIDYLPKTEEDELTVFNYRTKLGFGLDISGTGATKSKESRQGIRTSSLTFGSDDPISLISTGSGYWKYTPLETGIQFVTGYDYQTRFGWLGATFDKLIFRPLISWATAWSFDALKVWLEKGIHPYSSIQKYITVVLANFSLALIWIYQGLVPKILFSHMGEEGILLQAGVPVGYERLAALGIGSAEIILGLLFLAFPFSKRLHLLNILMMLVFAVSMFIIDTTFLVQPFGPIVLNAALIALSLTTLLNMGDLPHALHCKLKKRTS